MVGRGAALLGIDSAQLSTLLDQGNLHGAVGAEECGVLAVLVNVDLDVLGDPSLCAGNASVAGGIGSGSLDVLDAQLSAASLEACLTAGDGSVAQVALEGDVDEGLCALSSSLVDDGGAHCDLVDQQDHVSSSSDDSGILSSDACDEQDVVTGLLDLVDGSGHAGNSLADDDRLHIGIGSHVGDGSDGLLGLGGEVIGVGSSDNDVGVGVLQVLSSLVFFLALGHGAGDNADLVASTGVVGTSLAAAGSEGQDHDQSQQHSNQSLHSFLPPKTCFRLGRWYRRRQPRKLSPEARGGQVCIGH